MDFHTIEICAGVGMLGEGLRAGLNYLGHTNRTIAYLEREAYAASILVARMEDESLDVAPVWSDLLTFDGQPWRGVVDCIAAGFPCQDLSLAGRRAGLDGARSGLFFDILDIADACGARYLFLENVAGIASATASVVDEAEGALEERAAARVLGELADRGWNAEWLTLSASDVGASHGRARWFCWAWRLADTSNAGSPRTGIDAQHGKQIGLIGNCRAEDVDNPGRVQRRTGHEQDRPGIAATGRHEAHDGPADGSAELGHTDQQRAHGRRAPGQQTGRAEPALGSGSLADAQFIDLERWRDAGDVACTGSSAEGEAWKRERRGVAADGGSSELADTSGPRQQRAEFAGTCAGNRGGGRKHMDQLANFVAFSLLAQQTADGPKSLPVSPGLPQPSAKRLNPYFVERLMGWPQGWTSATAPSGSNAAEMELWRSRLQQQLCSFFDEPELQAEIRQVA